MDLTHSTVIYEELLKQVTEFKAYPLSKFKNPFSIGPTSGCYGWVVKVTADGYSASNAVIKKVYLVDPTLPDEPVEFFIREHKGIMLPGDILKISRVFSSTTNPQITLYANRYVRNNSSVTSSTRCLEVDPQSLVRFESFIVDFNLLNKDSDKFCLFTPEDWKIFFLLELFFSSRMLHLNNITEVSSHFISKSDVFKIKPNGNLIGYVDFVGLPVKRTLLDKSVALTIWDGSPLNLTSVDPAQGIVSKTRWANDSTSSQPYEPQFSKFYSKYLENYYLTVNVWNTNRPPDSPQFVSALEMNLKSNELVICFNVEKEIISPAEGEEKGKISLTMRSGQHQGKALRRGSPHSIIGRIFYRLLKERVDDLLYSLEPVQEKTSSNIIPDLPCIRLYDDNPLLMLCSDLSLINSNSSQLAPPQPGRISFPHFHKPNNHLYSLLHSHLPQFISFLSLVSTSEIRLSLFAQLMRNYSPSYLDHKIYGSHFSPEETSQVFLLAKTFRLILEFNIENAA